MAWHPPRIYRLLRSTSRWDEGPHKKKLSFTIFMPATPLPSNNRFWSDRTVTNLISVPASVYRRQISIHQEGGTDLEMTWEDIQYMRTKIISRSSSYCTHCSTIATVLKWILHHRKSSMLTIPLKDWPYPMTALRCWRESTQCKAHFEHVFKNGLRMLIQDTNYSVLLLFHYTAHERMTMDGYWFQKNFNMAWWASNL